MTAGQPIDATRGLASVRLTDRRVLREDAAELWARARQVAAVVLAAEDLGAADRAVQLGVAYAKERQAFGRAIGSYQSVKHLLVDAWVGVDQLRSLVWWAAWAADAAPEEFPLAASAAKAYAAQVFEQAAETVIQVHGGIGFTWEHDAHLYWRRAKVDRLLLGDEAEHLDAVARLVEAGARAPDGPGFDAQLTEIRYEVADGVATVTLDRPDHRNAFSGTMAERAGRRGRGRRTPTTTSASSW